MSPGSESTSQAVEIAPRIWWVGSILATDQFQSHVYLIEQGDQSVLIDPGSALIVDETIRKVDQVVGVDNVRWLVCSHADPDVIGALPRLVARGLHPDAHIVTHWRDEALIVHSGTPLPFWRIEEHEWRLPLADRTLRFVFSPYLHFAGAFCTFDEPTGTLFSGDLFGGTFDGDALVATSMSSFSAMRTFHEHYMPSREVLVHTLEQVRQLPPRQIAPQHGQIIREPLIDPIIERLERLECGIYLLSRDDPGLAFLLAANRTVRDVVDTLVREQRFSAVAEHLAEVAARTLGAQYLEIWASTEQITLQFESSDGFDGHLAEPPDDVWRAMHSGELQRGDRFIWPLTSLASDQINGAAVLGFASAPEFDAATLAVINQITGLVEVGLEREVLRQSADVERAAWHERAIHDPLTGAFNRVSLTDSFGRLSAFDDHHDLPRMVTLMIDIDHFKQVNDEHGHAVGDLILQHVARSIVGSVRAKDLVFRVGGEEFLVLMSNVDALAAGTAAERIRHRLSEVPPGLPPVTVSIGLALRRAGEDREALISRADEALYRAKREGRDRVAVSE